MKLLLAIFTAAVFAFSATFPAIAAEPGELVAAPAATVAPSVNQAKKVKKIKKTMKIAKHKAHKAHKTRH